MKKYLLLPLIALGLVAWVPNQAKAGVHVTFGFGLPTYYGPYYGGYYPGYAILLPPVLASPASLLQSPPPLLASLVALLS